MNSAVRQVFSVCLLGLIGLNGSVEFASAAGLKWRTTKRESLPAGSSCHGSVQSTQSCPHCGVVCAMGRSCECGQSGGATGKPDGLIFAAPQCPNGAGGDSAIPFPTSVGFLFLIPQKIVIETQNKISGRIAIQVFHPLNVALSPPTPPPERFLLSV